VAADTAEQEHQLGVVQRIVCVVAERHQPEVGRVGVAAKTAKANIGREWCSVVQQLGNIRQASCMLCKMRNGSECSFNIATTQHTATLLQNM
jgi:hypothetical protein